MTQTASRGLLVVLVVVLLGVGSQPALADPGDIGHQDQSFSGFVSHNSVPPSGTKPESKLWFNDGFWWAVMFHSSSTTFHIYRLNTGTQVWADTGTVVDNRNGTMADALWTGTKLYVASHVFRENGSVAGNPSRLYRFSYNASTDAYTLDGGFPVSINDTSSETLVIDRDSTGQLWATWTAGSPKTVWVNRTVCSPACTDTSWGTAFQLSANALASDDISSLVAFGGGRVGVMWSDQNGDTAFWFAVHDDTDSDTTWSAPEAVLSGPGQADDHINLKADSSGRVYAAVKTNLASVNPTNRLLVRPAAGGAWAKHTFGVGNDHHTRPIVVIDTTNNLARMFATRSESGGTIHEKVLDLSQADTDGVDFAPGLGTARIRDADVLVMNNATSTKQMVSAATGLVVLAANRRVTPAPAVADYWHHYDPLANGDITPPALTMASVNGATLRLTYDEGLDDGSTPAASAFAVEVDGAASAVTNVAVSGSLVTLTLAAPVHAGEIVTVSYAVPATNPLQDVAGNDAPAFTDQAATNSTPGDLAANLLPNGDGSKSAVSATGGGSANLFTFIDDGIATPDENTTYVQNLTDSNATYFAMLTNMPSNFVSMATLRIDARVRIVNRVDDNTTLFGQLFETDETTPLSDEVQIAMNPGPTNYVTIANVDVTGLVPGTKAKWDGAKLRLRWGAAVVGAADGSRLRITAVELHAMYNEGTSQAVGYLRAFTTPVGAVPANILIKPPGGPEFLWRNQWALDWLKLPPGTYTVRATAVEGFTPPADQQVTITEGNVTTISLVFTTLGNLRVVLSPAVPGTITIDGVRVNDWNFWAPYPAGQHTVCFGPVAGYDPPPCQMVTVAADRAQLATVNAAYTPNSAAVGESGVGYLRVAPQPAGQVPTLIYLNGQQRNQWGLDWLKLPPGTYTLSFSDVEGFRPPPPQQVAIVAGQVTTVTPQFELLGNLRVRTSPVLQATISVDGVPINDRALWTPFPAGQHEVCFGPVAGYDPPPCQTVTVAASRSQLTDVVGTYSPQ